MAFTYPNLNAMRNIDIRHIDPDTMPDIRDIAIDNDKTILERALDYIEQAKNPYFMRCGKILVKVEYSETDATIEDCIEGYFRSLV